MISIEIFLDGERYASRSWPDVPRVGESISLDSKTGKFIAIVNRVVWLSSTQHGVCEVDLYCERIV